MAPKHTIPRSARDKYIPLKLIGSGEDGIVVLVVPRSGPQTLRTCKALKIFDGDKTGIVSKQLFDDLKTMQEKHKALHPLASVIENSPFDNWYCMDFVPGYSIQQLLAMTYDQDGLPPSLIFHIFVELVRAQMYLKANNLCHRDLRQGGNVILAPPNNDGKDPEIPQDLDKWPKVVLVDLGGVKPYHSEKALEHVVGLIRTATNNESRVPNKWRKGLEKKSLRGADEFYNEIQMLGGGTLEEFWGKWEERTRRMKQALYEKDLHNDFTKVIGTLHITQDDFQNIVQNRGMEMTVEQFM